MKKKYKVNCYLGIPVITDRNGRYILRHPTQDGSFRLSCWRTGRHTKGHFKKPGQVFLTENGLRVAVIKFYPIKYNHRHRYTPLQRFTDAYVSQNLLNLVSKKSPNS